MPRAVDLTGQKIGRWTVLGASDQKGPENRRLWKCQCECGNIRHLLTSAVKQRKSCGCIYDSAASRQDISGQKFGRLTAIQRKSKNDWLCKCDCGKTLSVGFYRLRSGNTKSCGCFRSEYLSKKQELKIADQKFNSLTAIKRVGTQKDNSGHTYSVWLFKCDCGNEIERPGVYVTTGHTQSCGCQGQKTHGLSGTREYNIWKLMHERCNNPSHSHYKSYGGRGIKVCDRWNEFENFLKDIGRSPDNYSIERKNNDKGYCPKNCEWIPKPLQARNKRNSFLVEYLGEKKIAADWAEDPRVKALGIDAKNIYNRLHSLGWSPGKALTTPINR